MGPKNSASTHAIVPSKDLSWIDRMYLKLENMCVEVDKNPSMLLQETSKYMESHMNVVGANVKKLCTELIQDLISPPILSSEGADKLPECAIHCKCNCMDAEKPKQKGGDMVTKGSNSKTGHGVPSAKEGDKTMESINCQMQDISKGGDTKVTSREEEFSKQGQDFNAEGSTLNSEVDGKEFNVTGGPDDGEELTIAGRRKDLVIIIEAQDNGTNRELEEQLSLLPKESFESNGEYHDDNSKVYSNNAEHDVGRLMGEEPCPSAVACRGEVDLAEQASRPAENDFQELDTVDGKIAENINMVSHSSGMAGEDVKVHEVEVQHQVVDVFCETHSSRPDSISKVCREWHASHAKMLNSVDFKVTSLAKMDAKNIQSIGRNMEREEFRKTNEVGGDIRSMYSYVFSELSNSNKEEDSMVMSDFLVDGFQDEEQSAHWFDGEDVSKAIRAHNFCIEKLQQAEGCVRDYESDWELV